ncbi:MAG: YicC/YloC family endoribonuclease [bacterium]
MLLSMTGFGRGEYSEGEVHATAEVRSVNNRFLDISIRLPKLIAEYESATKELVRSEIKRGRVNVFVSLESPQMNGLSVNLDIDAARSYKNMLSELNKKLGIRDDVRLEHLLNFPDIFTSEDEKDSNQDLWKCTEQAIITAIAEMNQMRIQEGSFLAEDLLQRIDTIGKHLDYIEKISAKHAPQQFEALKDRLSEFLNSSDLDRQRLETEIAIMAERLDVTEECVRFHSHISLFLELVNGSEGAGRSLNFLLQEMNREANTIASKANKADIAHKIVFIKEEVERLREQIQNVE